MIRSNEAYGAAPARLILGFVAAMAVAKLAAALWTGFGDDEAYTLVISRRLALSYFDHPPLHQWILHGFVALAGEGHVARLPFWALHVLTNLPLFGLSRRLLGLPAALWTLAAFNASPYFTLMPDGYIMPDTPLLFALASAIWAVAEALYAPSRSPAARTGLWLAAGVAFGLAGLSKYSALLAPLGLFAFLAGSPAHRRWLADPRPYAAAAIALVLVSPPLIWNAEHGWASFAFQSGRAVGRTGRGPSPWPVLIETLGAQVAMLSPWIALPAVAGLYRAARGGNADCGERLLLWLAAPTLIVFAALPLAGLRPIPHWSNPGWLFAFPLAGAWMARQAARAGARWAALLMIPAALALIFYIPLQAYGIAAFLPAWAAPARDPTASLFDWPSVAATRAWRDGPAPPDLVLADAWRVGGRVGAALGPAAPICGFGADPRGFAYACDPRSFLGRDALLVAADATAAGMFAAAVPYFERIDPPESFLVGRGGRAERPILVARARRLIAPLPAR